MASTRKWPGTPGNDSLTSTAAYVIGIDPTRPGITDLAALRQGLLNGSVTPGTTGIVAALPLQGSAERTNATTTYALSRLVFMASPLSMSPIASRRLYWIR